MALESGELAAEVISNHLLQLAQEEAQSDHAARFGALAAEYRARYGQRFNSRLRVCSLLRRAVFFPRLAEAGVIALSASSRVRCYLARSTRDKGMRAEG